MNNFPLVMNFNEFFNGSIYSADILTVKTDYNRNFKIVTFSVYNHLTHNNQLYVGFMPVNIMFYNDHIFDYFQNKDIYRHFDNIKD